MIVETNRDKLIKIVQEAVPGVARYWAGLIAKHLIENGVEIPVHCNECKFIIDRVDGTHGCYIHLGEDVQPYFYCSLGENRISRSVKCSKCGFSRTVHQSVLQWQCPNCKHWLKVELGKK